MLKTHIVLADSYYETTDLALQLLGSQGMSPVASVSSIDRAIHLFRSISPTTRLTAADEHTLVPEATGSNPTPIPFDVSKFNFHG